MSFAKLVFACWFFEMTKCKQVFKGTEALCFSELVDWMERSLGLLRCFCCVDIGTSSAV